MEMTGGKVTKSVKALVFEHWIFALKSIESLMGSVSVKLPIGIIPQDIYMETS